MCWFCNLLNSPLKNIPILLNQFPDLNLWLKCTLHGQNKHHFHCLQTFWPNFLNLESQIFNFTLSMELLESASLITVN